MAQEKAEFLKGTLDRLILKVVAGGPIHGYAISQRIQQISRDFFQVPQGSLYPALHRLETCFNHAHNHSSVFLHRRRIDARRGRL